MPSEVCSGEVRPKGEQRSREEFGVLGGCFVDGDAEQRERERRVKNRSLVISVSLQLVVLAAVVLVPLFGKPERIAQAAYVPIPPYSPYAQQRSEPTSQPRSSPIQRSCVFCFSHLSSRPARSDSPHVTNPNPGDGDFVGLTPGPPNQILIGDNRTAAPPPPPPVTPTVVHLTHLDPAMLIRRIDPVYPTLPKQLHREGRVELHAIIATDGTIQSLQFAGGDPMFFASARDAVLQWRYRPTNLNGQPVEVDTTITVIYTLAH
jgi:periplasmic protein TonB